MFSAKQSYDIVVAMMDAKIALITVCIGWLSHGHLMCHAWNLNGQRYVKVVWSYILNVSILI